MKGKTNSGTIILCLHLCYVVKVYEKNIFLA